MDETFINTKWLLRTKAYLSASSAQNALHKARKELGIKPYGKITYDQFMSTFSSSSSPKRNLKRELLEEYNEYLNQFGFTFDHTDIDNFLEQ